MPGQTSITDQLPLGRRASVNAYAVCHELFLSLLPATWRGTTAISWEVCSGIPRATSHSVSVRSQSERQSRTAMFSFLGGRDHCLSFGIRPFSDELFQPPPDVVPTEGEEPLPDQEPVRVTFSRLHRMKLIHDRTHDRCIILASRR